MGVLDNRVTKPPERRSPLAGANRFRVASPGLSDVLFANEPQTFDTYATVASNIQAVEAALLFSAGLQTFVTLVGPSGWGKSHLLEASATRIRKELGRGACRVLNASEWVSSTSPVDPTAPLLLDNVHEAMERARLRIPFKLALERRVRAGRPTMLVFSENRAGRLLRAFLPSGREWEIAHLGAPEVGERRTIIHRIARSIDLSIGPCLEAMLAKGLRGNGRTLRGALMRLKLHGNEWNTDRCVLEACGIVNPFFADNSGWDLVGAVLGAAAEWAPTESCSRERLAIYTLLREAQLPEAEVARAVGAEPAAVYLRAEKFGEEMRRNPELQKEQDAFVHAVVGRLQSL
ncbi:MAG: hypothetical protein M9921_02600 [Fimbriimonadaceae bacterium]|nr:hypothetical protein [Chthonomonadaceae bacterium]MCO5295722.1 hypothetical protein [Fimbriimonadaceae bacterium]